MPIADSDFIQVGTKQIKEEWKEKEEYIYYFPSPEKAVRAF